MNRTSRFARTGSPLRQGPATVIRALDPVTGLPVRVYRFAGDPVPGADALDHPHLYRVLESGSDDDGGFVVAHLVEGAADVASRPELLDDAAAVAATAALAAAAHDGVAHGDMGAHRLHRRGSDVWLEGYGVPWAEAVPADDAVGLAAGLAAVEGHALSPAVLAVLEEAAESADGDATALARAVAGAAVPGTRAGGHRSIDDVYLGTPTESAAERAAAERAAARAEPDETAEVWPSDAREPAADHGVTATDEPAATNGPAATDEPAATDGPATHDPATTFDPADAERQQEDHESAGARRPPATSRPAKAGGPPRAAPIGGSAATGQGSERRREPVPPWLRRHDPGPAPAERSAPGAGEARSLRTSGGFSKQPPPDVSYRSGAPSEQTARSGGGAVERRQVQRQRRRTWLLAALLLMALLLAILTSIARRPVPPPAEVGGPVTSIVVDVRLEPDTLPPVSLVVVASPPGSRLAAGSVHGTVPRKVTFDAEGTWQVQGRFQERLSEVATFILPAERDVVLRFPPSP